VSKKILSFLAEEEKRFLGDTKYIPAFIPYPKGCQEEKYIEEKCFGANLQRIWAKEKIRNVSLTIYRGASPW
jgi:hypothetical protein